MDKDVPSSWPSSLVKSLRIGSMFSVRQFFTERNPWRRMDGKLSQRVKCTRCGTLIFSANKRISSESWFFCVAMRFSSFPQMRLKFFGTSAGCMAVTVLGRPVILKLFKFFPLRSFTILSLELFSLVIGLEFFDFLGSLTRSSNIIADKIKAGQ